MHGSEIIEYVINTLVFDIKVRVKKPNFASKTRNVQKTVSKSA